MPQWLKCCLKYCVILDCVIMAPLQWRHNGHDGVSNHQPHDCLLNRLFRHRSKKTSKLCVTGLCVGNSPGTDEFPTQMASSGENVSISWRHHDPIVFWRKLTCVLMAQFHNTNDNYYDKDNDYNNNCDDDNDDNYDDDKKNNNNNNNNNKNGLGCIIISLCSSGWMAAVFADQLTSCLYWQTLSRGTIIWTSFSVFLVRAASSGFMKNWSGRLVNSLLPQKRL